MSLDVNDCRFFCFIYFIKINKVLSAISKASSEVLMVMIMYGNFFYVYLAFYPGPVFGHRVLSLPMSVCLPDCVCPCVCTCVNAELVSAITHHLFE